MTVKEVIGRLICFIKGHIPIQDGHVTSEVYPFGLTPKLIKLNCLRCNKTLHLIDNASLLENLQRWQRSERCRRGLLVHQWLGDFGDSYQRAATRELRVRGVPRW